MASHNNTGKQGEQAALELLLSKGHILLAQNYRSGRAEVDLITRHGKYIVFTEVKTRSNLLYGQPETFVSKAKRRLMKQAAAAFVVQQQEIESPVRFDIVSVTVKQGSFEIYHIEDAFFDEPDPGIYN